MFRTLINRCDCRNRSKISCQQLVVVDAIFVIALQLSFSFSARTKCLNILRTIVNEIIKIQAKHQKAVNTRVFILAKVKAHQIFLLFELHDDDPSNKISLERRRKRIINVLS